jgi:hypothetical protein
MTVLRLPDRNLLSPTGQLNERIEYARTPGVNALRVMIPTDGDDSAGRGGSGGCRDVPFALRPFSGAA